MSFREMQTPSPSIKLAKGSAVHTESQPQNTSPDDKIIKIIITALHAAGCEHYLLALGKIPLKLPVSNINCSLLLVSQHSRETQFECKGKFSVRIKYNGMKDSLSCKDERVTEKQVGLQRNDLITHVYQNALLC